jgi:hypothetical protein
MAVKKASWGFTPNGGNEQLAAAIFTVRKQLKNGFPKDLTRRFPMFKRVGVLAMILAGSLGVLAPSVAQARDYDYHRRCERREYRHERWDRRHYRPYYYNHY